MHTALHLDLRKVRQTLRWTQQETAERLGVSQTLVSLVEGGRRSFTRAMLERLKPYFEVEATVLPLRDSVGMTDADFTEELANLGYPGFAHRRKGKPSWNPVQFLVMALSSDTLDRRVAEALPWLLLRYSDASWDWALKEAKLRDLANRLGFVVTLAREVAERKKLSSLPDLKALETRLERSRLARVDTFSNDGMTQAERKWLQVNSSPQAQRWNLLSDLKPEFLAHVD